MSDLATTASSAKAPPPESSEIVGARMDGQDGEHRVEVRRPRR